MYTCWLRINVSGRSIHIKYSCPIAYIHTFLVQTLVIRVAVGGDSSVSIYVPTPHTPVTIGTVTLVMVTPAGTMVTW